MIPSLLVAVLHAFAVQDDPVAGAVEAAVRASVKAMNEGKGQDFADLFHARRLVDEIHAQGGLGPVRDPRAAEAYETAIRAALPLMVAQQKRMGTEWGEILNPRVRLNRTGSEAEVSCLLKDSDGLKDRFRFWAVRDGEAWKIFDFESVTDGFRLSLLLTSFLTELEGDPQKVASLRPALIALQRAVARMNLGEMDEALDDLRAINLDLLPDTMSAIVEMLEGAILVGIGEAEEGLAVLERCLKRKPDLPRALRLKSEVCLQLGRFEKAVRAEEAYLKIIADDPDAYLNIGIALRELGRTGEAVEAHRKGAACDPEDPWNLLRLGILLAGRDGNGEAKKSLLEAFSRAGDADEVYSEAVGELMETGAAGLLLDLALDRAGKRPGDAEPLYHQGHALRRLGRHEEAREVLARARELDKDEFWWAELLEELACTLAHLGKYAEARALAGELEEVDEGTAAYVRAYEHAAGGRDADALGALRQAFKMDVDLHAKVAREAAFRRLRESEEGRILLAAAKAQAEYIDKSIDLYLDDRHEQLRVLAEARVKAAPGDSDAWYHLGYSLRNLGRHEAAEKALRTGLEREEAEDYRLRFWEELGQALARSGRPKEALEWAGRLLEAEDWVVEGHSVAAAAHALAGDRKAALASLGKLFEEDADQIHVVESDPAFREIRQDPEYAALVRRVRGREFTEE